jgi:FixJ family two-component response regulator
MTTRCSGFWDKGKRKNRFFVYEPKKIVDTMKKGAYDYLTKPVDTADLKIKIKNAFETAELRRTMKNLEVEKTIRLDNQLSWYQWKDQFNNVEFNRPEKAIDRVLALLNK